MVNQRNNKQKSEICLVEALAKGNGNGVASHYNSNTKSVVCVVLKNKKKLKIWHIWLRTKDLLEIFYKHCVTQLRRIEKEITLSQLTNECMQIEFLNVTQLHRQI